MVVRYRLAFYHRVRQPRIYSYLRSKVQSAQCSGYNGLPACAEETGIPSLAGIHHARPPVMPRQCPPIGATALTHQRPWPVRSTRQASDDLRAAAGFARQLVSPGHRHAGAAPGACIILLAPTLPRRRRRAPGARSSSPAAASRAQRLRGRTRARSSDLAGPNSGVCVCVDAIIDMICYTRTTWCKCHAVS
jgi:hypothetical protein